MIGYKDNADELSHAKLGSSMINISAVFANSVIDSKSLPTTW